MKNNTLLFLYASYGQKFIKLLNETIPLKPQAASFPAYKNLSKPIIFVVKCIKKQYLLKISYPKKGKSRIHAQYFSDW